MNQRFSDERDRLHAEAAALAGHERFGARDYLEGLTVLLESLDAGPELTPFGRSQALDLIRKGLVGRLYSQRGWDSHPGHRQATVTAPILILGLPRSGTTALHKLMAMDPQFQGIERWLLANPMPRPPRDAWRHERLYRQTVEALEARYAAAPQAQSAHPVVADEPDECLMPMSQSFVSNWWGSNLDAPGYDDWFLEQDEAASYRRYADNLRLIGLNAPDKRWLLKNPSHIMGVDALLRVFPDACLVHTVRHPAATIASLTNLLANIRKPLMGHDIDKAALARRQVRWYSEAVRRTMAATERQPDRIHEVDFRDFLARPLETVKGIYRKFGITMSAEAEALMRRWITENPQGKHGAHAYDLADCDLTEADIHAAFADYIDRYQLRDGSGSLGPTVLGH